MNSTYPFLGDYPAPEKLLDIYAYFGTEEGAGLDFRVPMRGPKVLIDLVGAKAASQLVPLFSQRAGCVVAAWKQAGLDELAQYPIVWIDSEGSPNAVFARNWEELLGMLHYHPGTFYDVLKSVERHAGNPEMYKSPMNKFPVDQFAADAEEQWAEDEAQGAFHHWLEAELGIPADRATVQHIAEAYAAFPKFQDVVDAG